MNFTEQHAAAVKAARDIVDGAKAANRDMTPEENTKVGDYVTEAKDLAGKIKAAGDSQRLVAELGAMGHQQVEEKGDGQDKPVRTIGEHFIKHAGARLQEIRGVKGASVSAPEFKAATDPQGTTGSGWLPVLTQVDTTIITAVRPRLVIADLLGSGTLSGNAISYFVESALEGAYTTVAEGAAKPQIHVVDPTTVTDVLKKIAGFIKFTDEMTEDLDFYVSEINQRLMYELGRFEEQQVLAGNGTGTNVLGLLNRSGIQTETAADNTDNADAIFRAMTKILVNSGLDPDGVVINPTDYQNLRLRRDANDQYFGGGYFQGQYGNGSVMSTPPLWGLSTVVTPAIAAGTVLVGAYKQAATLYRKGGVRVESTNSHASDFTSNLVTTRAEERVALALRQPLGMCKVTISNTAPDAG